MILAFAMLLAGQTVPAVPPMTVGEFLQQWSSLKPADASNGGSAKASLLVDEILSAGKAYKEQIATARAAGKQPRACPPEHFSMSGDLLVARFKSMSPSEQKMDVSQGVGIVLDEYYPCAGTYKPSDAKPHDPK